MQIKCSTCKETKDISEFAKRKNKRGCAYDCKECHKVYCKQHYNNNKSYYVDKNKEHRKKISLFIAALKDNKPCKDCGISYPYYVMDYDHLENKDFIISEAAFRHGMSKASVLREIKKCDLVCSNCHRERTHVRKVCSLGGSQQAPAYNT